MVLVDLIYFHKINIKIAPNMLTPNAIKNKLISSTGNVIAFFAESRNAIIKGIKPIDNILPIKTPFGIDHDMYI